MAALAKDPAHRWQTAEDFAEGLRAARAHIESGAPVGSGHGRVRAGPGRRPVANGDSARPRRRARSGSAAGPGSRSGCWRWRCSGCLASSRSAAAGAGEEGGAERGRQAARSRRGTASSAPGFEVRPSRVRRARRPFDQVVDQDPNARRRGRRGLDGDARGLGRARARCACRRWPACPREQAIDELEKQDLKVTRGARALRRRRRRASRSAPCPAAGSRWSRASACSCS